MTTAANRDPVSTLFKVLASPVLNAVIGIVGVALPVFAWVGSALNVHALLVVETVLVVLLVGSHLWLRQAYVQLRLANTRLMSDARYFELIRRHFERDLVTGFGDIADGHVQVYAAEVPRVSVLLFNTLVESSASQPRRVLAADLTTDPDLLTQRREYLNANRRLIEAGGTVQRLFICRLADLLREDYARQLLQLVDHHRTLGVTCGIAVRDRLRADQAVDFVVIANAAVLVEEDQGDAEYVRGRSSVYFKSVDRWTARFESVWGYGSTAAPFALQAYETVARPLLGSGHWDAEQVRAGTVQL